VEPGNPHCFWSAAQDGRVHQFDLRNADVTDADAPNMLIRALNSEYGTLDVEFKSLDINKVCYPLPHPSPTLISRGAVRKRLRSWDRNALCGVPTFPPHELIAAQLDVIVTFTLLSLSDQEPLLPSPMRRALAVSIGSSID
jgi:hypothetical protein